MAAAIPRHLLETLVNCPSCSQRYIEPRVLPMCGHTICLHCLQVEWKEKYTHSCPVKTCRKEICATVNQLTDLPLNQTVVDLLKSCNFHVEASGQCQSCQQSPSFIKCSHCCLSVCFECANQHRRETVTTLTNHINTLVQDSLQMSDQISQARKKFVETREKSLLSIASYYTRLIDELRCAQSNNEEMIDRQSKIYHQELESLIDDYKRRSEQITRAIEELRTTIADWSTIEEFKQLQMKLTHIEEDIREANEIFHERLPATKIFEIDPHEQQKKSNKKVNQVDSPCQTDELIIGNGQNTLATLVGSIRIQHLDDSTSSASSSTHHEPVKISKPMATRPRKKANHYRSLNTVVQHQQPPNNVHSPLSARLNVTHRAHPPVSGNSLLLKTTSNSIADLSVSMHQQKISSATIRLSSFQSKLDQCNADSYKKVPLSQSFDWGMLAITNANLILLYNKEKSSLVIFDAHGHENERIQWSDGDIKDLAIYHDDSILIVSEQKQAGKPLECKLYICNLTRKQLERERSVERGLNCQRVTSDQKLIYYASEKGCNKSKVSVFDHELQVQLTFECGVEIRSLAVDTQCCYALGKRREREAGRYFLEKRQKNGQLMRRIDLYELNVENMNRIIIDPISLGVIVTDGGNKKIWAIGAEGEKKSIQYRPWPWSVGFLTTDILIILHAGCLTFHAVNINKPVNHSAKIRNSMTNVEPV